MDPFIHNTLYVCDRYRQAVDVDFVLSVRVGLVLGVARGTALHKLAKNNPQKLIEKITDEDVGTIASIKVILGDDVIRNNFIKTMDNQSLSGKELKQTA